MKIKLFIFGKQRTLLSFNISHYKNTTSQGKPLSFTLGSEKLHIRFVQEQGDEAFLNWMLLKDENTQEYGYYERGKIVVYDNSGLDKKLQEYDFIAKPIAYQSVFHHEKGLVINMTLSADKMLVYNDKFYIKPYYYPKEHTKEKQKEEKTIIYIVDLEADKPEAQPNEKVTYKVTKYSQEKVTENDKKRIQWAIKIDGKQEVLKEKGEKLVLTIKEEWAGKELVVMPFLVKPIEKVSEKTKVIKWFLPRVLIQTKTYEGFGLKSERNIFEYQDANGNGLTQRKPTDPIAEDMHYGSGGIHTNNFKLSQIKDKDVLENIQRLNQYSTDNLFGVFKNLVEWTSKGALETNNLNMVNNMRYGTRRYQNPILTEAVFNHEETKKFIKNIVEDFKEAIRNNGGYLNKIKLESKKLKRPSFSTTEDRMEGLTIALNDTWAFRVTITKYSYNPQTKDVEATLKFRIIDHFGLDIADIESYGSASKIISKNWKITPLARDMALGFCAWFILQHLRGYKPFVTIMEKEQTLKFKI